MSKIQKILDDSFKSGQLSRKEHDSIMKSIHADGNIDDSEKNLLSTLFKAIQAGDIELVEGKEATLPRTKGQSQLLNEYKNDAIQRDQEQLKPQIKPKEESFMELADAFDETQAAKSVETPSAAEPFSEEQTDSFEDFFGKAQSRRENGKSFQLKNDRLLDVFLNGKVWMKTGSMVAYFGIVKFTREGFFEHGVKRLVKKTTTGEGAMLTKATGQGNIYVADQGKKISIVSLGGHSLVVNGTSLLAFEESINWDITFLRQLAAVWKGGIFNVRLSGSGMAAISTVGDPVMLRVKPHEPIMTDMNATVAWSGSLAPQFKTDIAMRTLVGRGSGESVQMRFEGDGFVIIQPYEEAPLSS